MNELTRRIKEMMAEKIKEVEDSSTSEKKYIYDGKHEFTLIKGFSPLESFFSVKPMIASNIFNDLFDELHPY